MSLCQSYEIPMSLVNLKKWPCHLSILRNGHIILMKWPYCCVNFKKWPCHVVNLKKWPCRASNVVVKSLKLALSSPNSLSSRSVFLFRLRFPSVMRMISTYGKNKMKVKIGVKEAWQTVDDSSVPTDFAKYFSMTSP